MNPPRWKEKDRRYKERHPHKRRANWVVQAAVKRGALVKPERCELCWKPQEPARLQGHHTDYKQPLTVTWLCSRCHAKEPKELHRRKAA